MSKKIFYYSLAVTLVLQLLFTSCKKVGKIEDQIIGSWVIVDTTSQTNAFNLGTDKTQGVPDPMILTFNEDNSFLWLVNSTDTVGMGVYEVIKQAKGTTLWWKRGLNLFQDKQYPYSMYWTMHWEFEKINKNKLKITRRKYTSGFGGEIKITYSFVRQ